MKRLLATVALGAALSTTPVSASLAQASPSVSDAPKPDLTRQQALQRADSLFDMFDLNHDGAMTMTEAQQVGQRLMLQRASTGRDAAPGIGGHTLKYLEHAFAGMEKVSRSQFEQALLSHFDAMDLNHDGVLTAAEREHRNQGEAVSAKGSQ